MEWKAHLEQVVVIASMYGICSYQSYKQAKQSMNKLGSIWKKKERKICIH